jgi:hypothetical protein
VSGGPFLATMFTIELPYMCYAYVDRVEIDVNELYWVWDTKAGEFKKNEQNKTGHKQRGYVAVGDEYNLEQFRPVKEKKSRREGPGTTHTIVKKCKESTTPCYYITVSFGLTSDMQTVKAVRLYGKAISLV